MRIRIKTISLLFFSFIISISVNSQVKLPRLISDGMVLQRNTELKIWGWAAKGEKVKVQFLGQNYAVVADSLGQWYVKLPKLSAGGPYQMTISASNTITVNDILVGEVWLTSGQSNIEFPMLRVSWIYPDEIAGSENDKIRYIAAPIRCNLKNTEKDLIGGSWMKANPQNVLKFSAISYFFAKGLYDKYKVPIGIINSSLGGSPIQAWMSEGAIKEFPSYYNDVQKFKDSALITKIESEDRAKMSAWFSLLWQRDSGNKDSQNLWKKADLNTSDWATMQIPGYWQNTPLEKVNGAIWFRKTITVPSSMTGKAAKLLLGRIIDSDSAYINGVFVGSISYQYPPRRYDIPANLLKEGENTVAVRIVSNGGTGGFVPDKPYKIVVGKDSLDISGEWKYKIGAKMEPMSGSTNFKNKPFGLYNAMISPLLNYKIKGAIWYQGESNTYEALDYRKFLTSLVKDWRMKWNNGNFPFLVVQLPNFMMAKDQPGESNWALLRESQSKVVSLPNTGYVVAIDLGEWNDIHPLNKKAVADRLVLSAQKVAYGDKKLVYSGPTYEKMKINGNKIELSFTNIGSGLTNKGGTDLKYFAIAGADKKFVWATAKIEKNKVIVWSDNVTEPLAVRYAWADNPQGANLYNKEGLPASPFRTDDW